MTLHLPSGLHVIETDLNDEGGPSYTWKGEAPACPECSDELKASNVVAFGPGDYTLVCDCGHEMEIQ